MKELYKVKDVARILNYTDDYIRQLCRSGKLSHFKVGSNYRFNDEHIRDYLIEFKSK